MSAAIFEAVLGNLAVSVVLGIIAFCVSRSTNRPALSHALWLLVLIKLLTPPLITISVPCLPAKLEPVAIDPMAALEQPTTPRDSFPAVIVKATPLPASRSMSSESVQATIPSDSTSIPKIHTSSAASTIVYWPSWESLLLGAWGAGALLSIAMVVHRARKFSRLLRFANAAPDGLFEEVQQASKQLGLHRIPRVRVVPGGIAPLVWSVGLPILYFPVGLLSRLTAEQRLSLITHELAHIQRWDHIVRLIEFMALAIYWWCPLAWIARRELRRLEEEACDADVLASLPGSNFAYASAIVETIDYLAGVDSTLTPTLASGIGNAASLRRRLVLILNSTGPAATSRSTRLAIACAGIALLVVCPKLARLSASVMDVSFGNAGTSLAALPHSGESFEEIYSEPVNFLPNPQPICKPSETGITSTNAVAHSPTSARLAMAIGSKVLVLDLTAKRVLFALTGHTEPINAVAFSPDGSRIATVSNDNSAIIWDAYDGRRLHTLNGHSRWVLCAAFSPDSRTLATGGYDKTTRLWDVSTGKIKSCWTGHEGGVRSVAFSPGGQTIATGGADHEVRLWDAYRGVTTKTLKKHSAPVRTVVFSPDGTRLASGSEDRNVQIWNPIDGREIGSPVPLPDYVTALAFASRGQALIAGTFGGHLLNINPQTGRARGYIGVEPGAPAGNPAHDQAIVAILIPLESKALYSVSQDGMALAWPSAGTLQTPRLVFRSNHPTTTVALSPDGKTLATAGQDGSIHLWDAATARELRSFTGHLGGVTALMFGIGNRLVSAGADERVRVWDVATGSVMFSITQPTVDLCIALSPNGLTLAIGGRKLEGITLVNLATTGKPFCFAESAGEVTSLVFTPRGDRIASGSARGYFRIWDAASGEEIIRAPAGHGSVDGISFNSTCTIAAIALNGGPRLVGETESGPTHDVVFLDAHDGSILDRPRALAHPSPITAAVFAAEDRVLTAASDGNLYLWNIKNARVLRVIHGHVDHVRGVALVPDGTAVFSAGDRSAKKWPLGLTEEK